MNYKFTITVIFKNGFQEISNINCIDKHTKLIDIDNFFTENLKKDNFIIDLEDRILKFISSEISYIRIIQNFK